MKLNKRILGREEECRRLERCIKEGTAQLVIVYGRRRVGKTFLINQFFNNEFDFKLTGIHGENRNTQLKNFIVSLKRYSQKQYPTPKDWFQAFEYLREYVGQISGNRKVVLFFDEMPWLDTHNSSFLPAFELFWNDYASTVDNIVIILCGSATAWMDKKIVQNKGGLFHRQTCKLYLEPFKLNTVEEYLKRRNIYWSRYDIAECYMVMGGIPYYLSLLDSELTVKQNIDSLFFKKKGELWDEFDHLYKTLFTNSEKYEKVVAALSEKRGGLTRDEIIEKTGLSSGGDLSKILDNLALSGFVRVNGFYGNKKKEALYQLADYYTLFYFRYIKNNYGKDENYWCNSIDNPARRTWSGLAFEQICKDHVSQIKHKLGISGVLSNEYSWSTEKDEEKAVSGAQIDLLIDRRDNVISVCEEKYSVNKFGIDKYYNEDLRNKIDSFVKVTDCQKSIQLVMITTYGLKNSKYNSIVTKQVLLDDLFNK